MPRASAPAAPPRVTFDGTAYDCRPQETVLDALVRHGHEVAYSCRKGVCLSCMLRARQGRLTPEAQEGLRPTLRDQGYFLPCLCVPADDLEVVPPDDATVYGRARVTAIDPLGPSVVRVALEPATELYYHAGQFINVRRGDGLVRCYSLASVPQIEDELVLHVKCLPGGEMSTWIAETLKPGEAVDIQGPNGACYYLSGAPDRPLLLIGNGTGLAPLYGIARDALRAGHTGTIQLYHGSRARPGLYLHDELANLALQYANFSYFGCLSGDDVPEDCRSGRAEVCAFADHADLRGWLVYLCGYPPMVHEAKKTAYLAGAALDEIHADPFELRELRKQPRD